MRDAMWVQANAFELRELSPHCRRCLALEEYRLLSDKHRHGVASAHVVRPYSPCQTNADSQIRRRPIACVADAAVRFPGCCLQAAWERLVNDRSRSIGDHRE
jgi:hypothetical protein